MQKESNDKIIKDIASTNLEYESEEEKIRKSKNKSQASNKIKSAKLNNEDIYNQIRKILHKIKNNQSIKRHDVKMMNKFRNIAHELLMREFTKSRINADKFLDNIKNISQISVDKNIKIDMHGQLSCINNKFSCKNSDAIWKVEIYRDIKQAIHNIISNQTIDKKDLEKLNNNRDILGDLLNKEYGFGDKKAQSFISSITSLYQDLKSLKESYQNKVIQQNKNNNQSL